MLKHIRRSSFVLLCAVMGALLLLSVVLAIHVGAVDLTPRWVFQILANKLTHRELFAVQWPGYAEGIVWGMRLPKVLVAACVGAGLSIVGIVMQALTKNSMADPYLLGISSGASAGAAAAILLGVLSVGTGAFAGAILSSVLVFLLSGASGRASATKLILSGVAVSALFSAVTNLLIFLQGSDKKLSSVLFWMTGSFAGVSWEDVVPVALSLGGSLLILLLIHRALDAMLLGEQMAVTVGVDVPKLKILMIVLSALVTGILVSVSGTVGFVGLIVPHAARSLVGTAHRRLIPFAALLGGIFMIWADVAARVVVAPSELPIGVVTAFLGAPFFLVLLRRSGYAFR